MAGRCAPYKRISRLRRKRGRAGALWNGQGPRGRQCNLQLASPGMDVEQALHREHDSERRRRQRGVPGGRGRRRGLNRADCPRSWRGGTLRELVPLRYRLWDDSGQAQVEISVTIGGRTTVLKTPFRSTTPGATYTKAWRAPKALTDKRGKPITRRSVGKYCVLGIDRTGTRAPTPAAVLS